LQDGPLQCSTLDAGKPTIGTERFAASPPNGAAPWVFSDASISEWLDGVRANHPTLGKISTKIAQGLVTSADEVFFLRFEGKRYFSEATGKVYDLEDEVVHPVLKGSLHMKRWLPLQPDRAVLFPYEEQAGAWRLIPEKRFAGQFP